MAVSVNGVIDTTEELVGQVKHLAGIVDAFFAQPLPDAVEALIYRCDLANQNNTYLSAFERYGARLLRAAQAERLRRVFSRHEIGVGRLSCTGLCWLSFDYDLLSDDEVKVVLGVESAINRLIMLVRDSKTAEDVAVLSSAYGETDLMRLDWDKFSKFGSEVDAFSASMQSENPLQAVFGVQAPKGGEWDTRTRFARYMESISAPFRLAYRFDCEVNRGLFEIHVSTLTPSIIPARRDGATLREWSNGSPEGHRISLAYALRLCAFVAGAAFFSNVAITDVVVTAHRRTLEGGGVASLYFERMPYLINALPALKMGELATDEMIFDPLATARKLAPSQCAFAFDDEGRARYIDAYQIDFSERRIPTWLDERAVPDSVRQLLHADKVSDLDITHLEDSDLGNRVRDAALDVEEFPMASLAEFEDILSHEDAKPDSRSLFCVDEGARVLMGLRDRSAIRFRKYPDAYFVALKKSASINEKLGDIEASLVYAKQELEVAPTSVVAYTDLASANIEAGHYNEAVRLLKLGLCFAIEPSSIHYLYYRLAYALYKAGLIQASVATYVHLIEQDGRFKANAIDELKQIISVLGLENRKDIEMPDLARAREIMTVEGIPLAPTTEVARAISEAMIALVEEGIFNFGSALCWLASQYIDRDVMSAVASSIRLGVNMVTPCEESQA